MQTLKIGTRGSKLAIAQTKIVEKALKEHFADLQTEIVVIHTMGDKILDKPLSEIGDKGLFINEFENALAQNKIDIAVHSAKDLPSELKDGLEIICTPIRADARDVLVIKKGVKQPVVIGTSSQRREFYIQKYFPQAQIKTIRGNIDTRLKKLENGEYDAIVLAKAGLDRLKITETLNEKFDFRIFDTDKIVPAACQGIIAVEAKKDFKYKKEIAQINDNKTFRQYKIERETLKYLQVNCSDINGVYSNFYDENNIDLTIMYKGKEIKTTGEYSEIYENISKLVSQIKS